MNILVISGSPRTDASSLNLSHYIQQALSEFHNVKPMLLDLHQCDMPMWHDKAEENVLAKEYIDYADGYVFVIPEWHGMVPPAFKNLFFFFNGLFAHKPAYIVGVSSGNGGRYPIVELRSSTYKNSFINYIPISTVVDHVNKVIDGNGNYIDETNYMAERLDEGLQYLLAYTEALRDVRSSAIFEERRFKNGM